MRYLLVISVFLVSCGYDSENAYEPESHNCSSCTVQEDVYGDQVLVCSDSVPIGTLCYGGLRFMNRESSENHLTP